jgi:antitoxin ChpS
MLQTLRKAGGSLVMTVPKAFVEQNGLAEGSEVPRRPRYKIADLMAEMPARLPKVKGWDEMPAAGLERE